MKNLLLYFIYIFFYAYLHGSDYGNLVENSPFCQHKNLMPQVKNLSSESKNFELHGIWESGDEVLFSLHDKNINKNFWIPLNGKHGEISVKIFHPENRTLEISLPDGKSYLLKLETATSASTSKNSNDRLAKNPPNYQVIDEKARERFLNFMNEKSK